MKRLHEFVDSLASAKASLSPYHRDRLHVLLSEWQVLSDLWSADLLLWLHDEGDRYIAVDHCRPGTGSTIHLDDVIGLSCTPMRGRMLTQAVHTKQVLRPVDIRWAGAYAVEEVYIPVVVDQNVVAVMSAERSPTARPGISVDVHNWYDILAGQLAEMIARGEYPYDWSPSGGISGNPRVADGVIWIDDEGVVLELSPNAISCFRHLGFHDNLKGKVLAEVATDLISEQSQVDEALPLVVMGRYPWMTELETGWGAATLRAFPLTENGDRRGAFILCRDVSEMRRHERALMSKDAMIREIHHRVKNNLQTVSALLRMQSRRSKSQEVKTALGQAERRIAAIAQAHRILSHNVDETVDFDEMMASLMNLAASMASTHGSTQTVREGSFGRVNADTASSLSVVITELVTNAVEHGLKNKADDGRVIVKVNREDGANEDKPNMSTMTIDIIDNGTGIGEGEPDSGMGTHIVKTLVNAELKGTIEWLPGDDGVGTRVHMVVHVPTVN